MSVEVEDVVRTIFESRSLRGHRTDEEWERVKASPVFAGTLRRIREEAVEMIDNGEFD